MHTLARTDTLTSSIIAYDNGIHVRDQIKPQAQITDKTLRL
jgi:hypothetical protein